MPSLSARVRRFAARHDLWTPRTRVIAGVSGGSDSVALLLLLRELSAAGELTLAGAAHVHHHLRPDADDDERFVRSLADELGVPLQVAHADVPAEAARDGRSVEVAARDARHRCLAQVAEALGAERIATAHTVDDQAETVLMRIARGTGTAGLGAIGPRRGVRIRPLLAEPREVLRAWLEAAGRTWREDLTNADGILATGFATSCCPIWPCTSTRRSRRPWPVQPTSHARTSGICRRRPASPPARSCRSSRAASCSTRQASQDCRRRSRAGWPFVWLGGGRMGAGGLRG